MEECRKSWKSTNNTTKKKNPIVDGKENEVNSTAFSSLLVGRVFLVVSLPALRVFLVVLRLCLSLRILL